MKIVIPTYRRPDAQKTLATLHPDLHDDVVLVVRPEEKEAYSYVFPHLEVLPDTVKDIAATRQYIWDKYSKSEDVFALLDDDITDIRHIVMDGRDRPVSQFMPTYDQFDMFAELVACLNDKVGIVSPRPSWQMPAAHRYPIHSAAFCTGFYVFNAKLLRDLNLRFDRFTWAGDIDFIFQVLSHGIDTQFLCTYKYNIDANSKAYDGDEYERLAAMWSKYIKRRPKDVLGYDYADEGPSAYKYHRKQCLKDARIA